MYIFMGNVFLVRTDYGLVVRLANVMIVFFAMLPVSRTAAA